MPKVLRIINRFNLGGITYNVSYLSRYLSTDYETLLIGGPEEKGEESSLYIPHSLGLKPLIIEEMRRSINPFQDYFAYKRIKKIIKEFKPDIVHTHASKAGAIGRMAAIHCGVPILVHTFHGHVFKGYFGPFITGIFIKIEQFLSKRTQAIIAISNIQKKDLTAIYKVCKSEQTFVVSLGFDLRRFSENQSEKRTNFRNKYQLTDETIAIGIIGRLAPIKNHYLFIDAIAEASKKSHKKIKAFIIGDGETKLSLQKYLAEKQLSFCENKIEDSLFIYTSWIKDIDVALAGLDIVALSSKNEGTPVSLIEAQAAGKFIVSTNVGGIEDILHLNGGFLSSADDTAGFKNNILLSIEDFDHLNSKAKLSQEIIIKKFSYERLCCDMEEIYKNLLNSKDGHVRNN
jgi:glycosyltransferase involved in cell wall biosynthesis